MNLFTIALKSLRQRALASILTALSVALGVMLVVGVLLLGRIINETFGRKSVSYDFIVGPKGSDMQLVLSSIYRIEPPIANLPYLFYQDLKHDPMVADTVPLAFGDYTQQGGFPIVGTLSKYFAWGYARDKEYRVTAGRFLRQPFDAVIGSEVARRNGWSIGSKFKLVHGGAESTHVHNEEFEVVGVLAPTGTPDDRTAFIQLNGFYAVAGHEKPITEAINGWRDFNGLPPLSGTELDAEAAKFGGHAHDHSHGDEHAGHHHAHATPDIQKEVTAILVRLRKPPGIDAAIAAPAFENKMRKGFKAQAVNPIKPMARLQNEFVGTIRNALLALTVVILAVSGVSIFVSIYNSMSERLREIAVMRALGARRETVFGVILAESLLLCLVGGAIGVLAGHLLIVVATPVIRAKTNLLVEPWAADPAELWLLPALVALAIVAGVLPGLRAYRADVAESLMD